MSATPTTGRDAPDAPGDGRDDPARIGPSHPAGPAPAEFSRKGLHMAAAATAAAIAAGLPDATAQLILAAAVAVAFAVEAGRRRSPAFRRRFVRLVGPMLRPSEFNRLSGATTLALGCAAAVFLFPGQWAAIGCLYVGFADSAAAFAGRRFGRRRAPWGASIEGASAFFIVAASVGWLTPALSFGPAVLAAALAASLEGITPHRFDNLVVPVGGAAAVGFVLFLVS